MGDVVELRPRPQTASSSRLDCPTAVYCALSALLRGLSRAEFRCACTSGALPALLDGEERAARLEADATLDPPPAA
jgi:hypothetical protein